MPPVCRQQPRGGRLMTDSRLEQIAADAKGRGWQVKWPENDDRTELIVTPRINSEIHERMFGIGFGVALGGEHITCWIWEAWGGALIEPEIGFDQIPADREVGIFPVVTSFNRRCPSLIAVVTTSTAKSPTPNPFWDKSALEQWPLLIPAAEKTHAYNWLVHRSALSFLGRRSMGEQANRRRRKRLSRGAPHRATNAGITAEVHTTKASTRRSCWPNQSMTRFTNTWRTIRVTGA